MNVRKPIWTYLARAVVFLLVVAMAMMVAVWYWPLIRTNEILRKRLMTVEADLALEKQKLARKEALIEALANDPKTVERLARENLGLARTGETVVHFEARGSNFTVTPPTAGRP